MRQPCVICGELFDGYSGSRTCGRECSRQYRAGMPVALRHAARVKQIEKLRAKGLTFRESGERSGVTAKAVSRSYRHARKRSELHKMLVMAETDVSLLQAALIG